MGLVTLKMTKAKYSKTDYDISGETIYHFIMENIFVENIKSIIYNEF